jgi:hypothetical protein
MMGTVERALELARSGSCRDLGGVERALKKEGHGSVFQHLASPALRKQLRASMRDAADPA